MCCLLKKSSKALVAVLFLSILLTGCTVGPSIQKLNAFGGATNNLTEHVQSIRVLNVELAQDVADKEAFNNYIAGNAVPPKLKIDPSATIPDEIFKVRLDALKSLKGYSKSLADLKKTDTSEVTKAVDGLVSSVSNYAALSGFSIAAIPILGPVSKFIGTGTGVLVEQQNEIIIINEIQRADPYVQLIAKQLDTDFKTIKNYLEVSKVDFLAAKHAVYLNTVGRVSENQPDRSSADYEFQKTEFFKSLKKVRAYRKRIKEIDKMLKAISHMADAHKKLKNSNDDNDSLVEFLDTVSKL